MSDSPDSDGFNTASIYMLGCGKMGAALVAAWIKAGISPQRISACVATSSSAETLSQQLGIQAEPHRPYNGESTVVLAVKPQMLDQILSEIWHAAPEPPLYISIAAGKPLAYFAQKLGTLHRVIRAMPNTPAQIGQGLTTLVAGTRANADDRSFATRLFTACGSAVWLENEAQLDAATAVAGSGPAYVFHFGEALLEAAIRTGLPHDIAQELVQATLSGSIALAEQANWHDLSQLRRDVTSKGGVTQAALDVLMPELPDLLFRVLQANIRRSQELR